MAERIRFNFNARKAVEAAVVLLKREPHRRTNYMRLLKLLYIADRESLKETGFPITGDTVYAMDRGPVLSSVLKLIKSEHQDSPIWDGVIRKDRFDVEAFEDPGLHALSMYEVRKLHEVSERHADLDEWQLSHLTHAFPEYVKNEPPKGSRQLIDPADILDAVAPGADKESIASEAAARRATDRIFGG